MQSESTIKTFSRNSLMLPNDNSFDTLKKNAFTELSNDGTQLRFLETATLCIIL
jgi:hypothetical protein